MTAAPLLNLGNTRIAGEGLLYLTGLKNLRFLNLGATRVNDESLKHLAGLTSLEHLYLGGTRITNAGLIHLKGFTKLKELVCNKQVTDAGAAKLRESLPNVHIDYTRDKDRE
ncbi:MAG TPA: hypothetical protein VMG10_19375 [Gemmataceae bacterium]|nr:hypothetical protein [Gemmataceae bacterium]